jgi:3-dehydroquinate dehydratase/shikimate dehydrogenase
MNSTAHARVCIPVCCARASELAAAVARAAQHADIVELRLDCLDATQLAALLDGRALAALVKSCARPLILTFRPSEQGGARALDLATRRDFWTRTLSRLPRDTKHQLFADIELDLLSAHPSELREAARACEIICSHHDFEGVPRDIEEIYERMTRTPAHVFKIAALAGDITDCLALLRLLERARRDGRELIAIAMGEAGTLTRILAPSRGAFLTYAALDETRATAPGQLRAGELRSLYRIDSLNEQTEITGLVGRPVAHSLSPHMHNAAFSACRLNGVYLPFEVRDLDDFMRRMAHPRSREWDWRLRGLSVTAPHKSAVMRHLDWIEPAARDIGAVNTIVCEGATLKGYNTDAAAALAPLEGVLQLSGARVAVIGAGGAARAVLWSLREHGAHSTTVFARDIERARPTAQRFDAHVAALNGARFDGFDLVVNTTPLGTRGERERETPARAPQLRGARVVYDLVYNPPETLLLNEARAAGCRTFGGLPMLVAQAARQFKLWTGQDAPAHVMRAAAERQVMERQMLDVGG